MTDENGVQLDINILYKAIESNVSISLGKIKDNEETHEYNFVSRFLDLNRKKKRLKIDLPSATDTESDDILLKKDDDIRVFFIFKGFRFLVFSTVLGLTKYSLPSGKTIPALTILLPDKLIDGERRNFFKVFTPLYPMELEIIERPDNQEEDLSPPPLNEKFTGIMYDISGGGIAILEGQTTLPLYLNDILDLYFHLEEDGPPLHMEGRVLNKRQHQNMEKYVYGIEFIQQNISPLEIKRNVTKIMRYVMKRQREIIFQP